MNAGMDGEILKLKKREPRAEILHARCREEAERKNNPFDDIQINFALTTM